jgi:hypothetical protein
VISVPTFRKDFDIREDAILFRSLTNPAKPPPVAGRNPEEKLLFGKTKRHLSQVFYDLARRKECRLEERHMLISIPPEHSVARIIGYRTGRQAIGAV